jgi:hypothetical protein
METNAVLDTVDLNRRKRDSHGVSKPPIYPVSHRDSTDAVKMGHICMRKQGSQKSNNNLAVCVSMAGVGEYS